MSDMSVQNSLDTSADYIKDGFDKHIAEFVEVYAHLNALNIMRAAATEPTDPSDYECWVDITVPAAPTMKVFIPGSPGSFVSTNTSALAVNGIALETMLCEYMKNCKLIHTNPLSLIVQIQASSNVWAVAYIGTPANGGLYRITSTISYDFDQMAEDTYYMFIQISGQGFVLHAQTSSTNPDETQYRYVGTVSVAGGTAYVDDAVESYNVQPLTPY